MKWALQDLKEYNTKPLSVDETLNVESDLLNRYSDGILSSTPFQVHADVLYDRGNAVVNARATGEITVPSSRSLTPVKMPLDFHIDEIYVPDREAIKLYDKDDVVMVLGKKQIINFDKSVADNIILQIPMHILSPKEDKYHIMPKGHDWEVMTEDEFYHPKADHKHVDPRLAKLKDYFKNK
ncbi:DNA-binding protein [Philodulcilactobacillus myokoensis]|uniref:DNA-binding protein n=1 Tax=Philodulcilactobacillus myokoensis TaxID=2929573 RepID=A0A9W6ET24_9LACO|nr:YceD family protein [Philodulcilactobacillus myokoensis]GLB46764.1 DNA-binding protein [Philodulcilactobacillus myokoensis]